MHAHRHFSIEFYVIKKITHLLFLLPSPSSFSFSFSFSSSFLLFLFLSSLPSFLPPLSLLPPSLQVSGASATSTWTVVLPSNDLLPPILLLQKLCLHFQPISLCFLLWVHCTGKRTSMLTTHIFYKAYMMPQLCSSIQVSQDPITLKRNLLLDFSSQVEP